MELVLIEQLLEAGGNVSTMLLVYFFWRFDKRLSYIEWQTEDHKSELTKIKKATSATASSINSQR